MVRERVLHLFIDCQIVKPLFCILERWFKTTTKSNMSFLTHDLLPLRCDPEVYNVLLVVITEFKYAIWLCRLSKKFENNKVSTNFLILVFISQLKLKIQADFKRLEPDSFDDLWVLHRLFCGIHIDDNGSKLNFFF